MRLLEDAVDGATVRAVIDCLKEPAAETDIKILV